MENDVKIGVVHRLLNSLGMMLLNMTLQLIAWLVEMAATVYVVKFFWNKF